MSTDLSFRIGAELGEIKTALAGLRAEFAAVGKAASGAGSAKAFGGIESGAGSALASLRGLVLGFASVATAIKAIGTADELNTLNARLKLVTKSTDEFAQAQVKLFDLAQRSRSSLTDTISLYSRIALATKDAGVGQETLLGIVETINQAVQLSGSSTQAAEAALIQLGQGLASGTLLGEELNSVLEQTPALADAIAKGLGKTRGELRQLGQDGKLSAQQVIAALQAQRGEVAAQFAQLPVTVGQSLTLLRNAGLQLVGTFDTATGATSGLAGVIKDLSEFLSSDAVLGAVVEYAKTFGDAFAQIVKDAREAVQIIKTATVDITGSGEDLVQLVGRAFTELPRNLRSVVRIVTITFAGMVDRIIADATLAKEALAAIFTDDTIAAAIVRRNVRVTAAAATVRDMVDEEVNANRRAAAEAKKAADAAIAARNKARAATGNTSTGTFRPTVDKAADDASKALAKAQADVDEKLLQDSSKRALGILENQYADAKLTVASYFETRRTLELASLDSSIAIERARLATSKAADRTKILGEIELLERAKTDIELKAARDRDAAVKDLEKQLRQVQVRDLENRGQTAEATRVRLQAEFQDLIARLQTEGKTAEVKRIQDLIELEANRAKFEQLKAEAEQVIAALEAKQQSIANQRTTGAITPAVAEDQSRQARDEAIPRLDGIAAELGQLRDIAADPKITEGVDRFNVSLETLKTQAEGGLKGAMNDLRSSLANLQEGFAGAAVNAGVDALNGLFNDLVEGSKSGKQALLDFVASFVRSMAQIASKALSTYLALQGLSFITGIPVQTLAAGLQVGASVKHSGGMAGTGPVRRVNPLLFAGAPRFHGGGLVGLKPDERPAILQTGERVLNRQQTADYNGGGAGSGGGTRVINVIDPNLVQDYMTSSAGERTILNVIERNAGAVRQKIA